jgi:hypothetical protein
LDFCKKVGFGHSSVFAKVRTPALKQLPNVIGLGVPPINRSTATCDPESMVKPSVDHHLLEAWNLKPARFKEKPRLLLGQHTT